MAYRLTSTVELGKDMSKLCDINEFASYSIFINVDRQHKPSQAFYSCSKQHFFQN